MIDGTLLANVCNLHYRHKLHVNQRLLINITAACLHLVLLFLCISVPICMCHYINDCGLQASTNNVSNLQ